MRRRLSAGHRFVKPYLNKKLALEAVQYCLGFVGNGDNAGLLLNSMDFMKEIKEMVNDNIPSHLKVVTDYSGRIIFDNGAELRIFPKHMEPLARSLMGGDIFIAKSEDGDPRLRFVEDIMLS